MVNQHDAAEQARALILGAQPDDFEARKKALALLNENDLLVGRARAKAPWESAVKLTVSMVVSGERLDPTTRVNFTALPRAVLVDEPLMVERLGLTADQLPKARPILAAMAADLKGE